MDNKAIHYLCLSLLVLVPTTLFAPVGKRSAAEVDNRLSQHLRKCLDANIGEKIYWRTYAEEMIEIIKDDPRYRELLTKLQTAKDYRTVKAIAACLDKYRDLLPPEIRRLATERGLLRDDGKPLLKLLENNITTQNR